MWMLTVTVCLLFDPGDGRCERRAYSQPDKVECLRMLRPLTEYLESEAKNAGADDAQIKAGCRTGVIL